MYLRRTPKYEEELVDVKQESEQHLQLLDDACEQPRVVLHSADVSEKYLRPEQQEPESPHIKKEEEEHPCILYIKEEPLRVKKEEVEDRITKSSLTCASFKSDDEDRGVSEDDRGAEPPENSSKQHMTTEGDADHCGPSQAQNHDIRSYSADTDDDGDAVSRQTYDPARHWFLPC
ncbi:uncharacterized protein LOC144042962 isoform X6 [Vanacampus margaritifer]